jgi:two-component system, cell cycle response regulator
MKYDFDMVYNHSKDLHVLYAEDNEKIRESTGKILQKYFSTLDVAVDGLDAMEKYKKYHADTMQYYDLVITDINMPRMNGIELCDAIFDINDDQALIIISAYDSAMYLFELIDLGISSFIFKPIRLKKLNRTLYRVCKKIQMHKEELEHQQIQENERQFFQSVVDLQDNLIVISDGNHILSVNQPVLNFFNYRTLEDFKKYNACISDAFKNVKGYFHLQVLQEDELWIEHILHHQDQDFMVTMQNATTLKDESFKVTVNYFHGTKKYIVTFSNITKIALKNKEDRYNAIHDNLTGIYNRYKLNELLPTHFTQLAGVDTNHFAFILFDIDHFKGINDIYGHLAGDQVLREITSVIKENIREEDIFIRWGGDEFILVIEHITPEKAIRIAEHLRDSIKKNIFEKIGHLTCSFGVTLYQKGDTLSQMFSRADKGLYEAKKNGRNRVGYV